MSRNMAHIRISVESISSTGQAQQEMCFIQNLPIVQENIFQLQQSLTQANRFIEDGILASVTRRVSGSKRTITVDVEYFER